MIKHYVDFYGTKATIKKTRNGYLLKTFIYGRCDIKKTYSTERGARIALGKMSDEWREVK